MVLKTFSLQEDVYDRFSAFCREHGMNRSKQVEMFMKSIVSEEPMARKDYLEKLERIRSQKAIHVGSLENFRKRYGIE
jgi:antitoxin component of RelBE/YafQ-DinJ toxin-antitoxin module